MPSSPTAAPIMTSQQFLEHWQGHRALTRRVIEAFPEDQLFTFSVGGMRPFGALALEMMSMALPMVRGAASGDWTSPMDRSARPKAELLAAWDADTPEIDAQWARIPAGRFQETMTAFGQYTAPLHELLLYCIDNEIHHRAQGYVYLRALGVEPPPFWER